MVSTVEKGDELENKFYKYLLDQQSRGDLVFGVYPPDLCTIYQKKRYPDEERNSDVTFDVVIEIRRQGSTSPHSYVIFECKNYEGAIPDIQIRDFSDKLSQLFKHAAKGVIVVSSRLNSGAENIAKNRKMAIIKYDEHGTEIIADRRIGTPLERNFVETQLFEKGNAVKPLKFSAFYDGKFYGSVDHFFRGLNSSQPITQKLANDSNTLTVPYLGDKAIRNSAQRLLEQIAYKRGPVDLKRVCLELNIDLQFTSHSDQDEDGNLILGSMNFDRKSILIYSHDDKNRERFTIAHEIGHFFLKHDRYLRSETIIEKDLIIRNERESIFNFDRLECQANIFASDLILPRDTFLRKTEEYRNEVGIKDKGHGYIFVDDQTINYGLYNQLRFQSER